MLVRVVLILTLLCVHLRAEEPRLGTSVNIFYHYGFLSITMKVFPSNEPEESWIFRERSYDIFNKKTLPIANPSQKVLRQKKAVFHGDFHIEFCETPLQLLQGYFRNFTIEKLEKPWKAFSASWTRMTWARNLGIDITYLTGEFSYVLLRFSRHHRRGRLDSTLGTPAMNNRTAEEVLSINPGNTASVMNFVEHFGSHYISEFVTGNSLYQVFVYSKQNFKDIKHTLEAQDVMDMSTSEVDTTDSRLLELDTFFSPRFADHVGEVKTVSGNTNVETWAMNNLRQKYFLTSYISLFKLQCNKVLLQQLDTLLGDEALLQLDLKSIGPTCPDRARQKWFEEVIDNNLILWDINM